MDAIDRLDRFQFEDQPTVNQDVKATAAIQVNALLLDWHRVFQFERDRVQIEFMRQARLVC